MTDKVWREWTGRTDIAGLSLPSDQALGTWRDPANVAPFCVHLLSERGGRISGRAFAVVGDQVSLLREPEYGPHIASSIGEDVADLAERADTAFGDLGGPADSPWPPPVRVTLPAR
jgi:hypothetical protein